MGGMVQSEEEDQPVIEANKFNSIWITYQVFKQGEENKVPMQVTMRSGSLETVIKSLVDLASSPSGTEYLSATWGATLGAIFAYIVMRIRDGNEVKLKHVPKNVLYAYAAHEFELSHGERIKEVLERKELPNGMLGLTVIDFQGRSATIHVNRHHEVDFGPE